MSAALAGPRRSYRHVGLPGPTHGLRPLTPEERVRFARASYAGFEPYPEGHWSGAAGRYWTVEQVDLAGGGCGAVSTMSQGQADAYARRLVSHGEAFCERCRAYLPIGVDGEFVWDGTDERLGA